ncbi:hypothetical protein U5801_21570 [Lamprobacter modestohalophilus]|uniref:hypothetical protein n=1 Tax=Lamprobacter modestohalophilus TaxID=1064514 RepID=UPI002ADEBD05|nr:hypothetical protein [Lamprobacter modestohalophilus]MEA1052374.1 hypothetical protein [Lamprobacter modestohalophilus]
MGGQDDLDELTQALSNRFGTRVDLSWGEPTRLRHVQTGARGWLATGLKSVSVCTLEVKAEQASLGDLEKLRALLERSLPLGLGYRILTAGRPYHLGESLPTGPGAVDG